MLLPSSGLKIQTKRLHSTTVQKTQLSKFQILCHPNDAYSNLKDSNTKQTKPSTTSTTYKDGDVHAASNLQKTSKNDSSRPPTSETTAMGMDTSVEKFSNAVDKPGPNITKN
jgi:hypothetical protein